MRSQLYLAAVLAEPTQAQQQMRRVHVLRIGATLAVAPLMVFALATLLVNVLWGVVAQGQPAPGIAGQELFASVIRLGSLSGAGVVLAPAKVRVRAD